jgi:hypothetical protein
MDRIHYIKVHSTSLRTLPAFQATFHENIQMMYLLCEIILENVYIVDLSTLSLLTIARAKNIINRRFNIFYVLNYCTI